MTEYQEQSMVFKWSQMVRTQYPDLKLLFHIKNETTEGAARVAIDRKSGVKPGVPDLFLPVGRDIYHGLFIEMKAEKGRASFEQLWWIDELQKQGYYATVCHGFDSARRTLEWYLNL